MNLLSTQQAAEKLGVSERRVRSLITEGKLVAHRLGRDYAIEENVLSNVLVYGKRGRPKKPDAGETADMPAVKAAEMKAGDVVKTPASVLARSKTKKATSGAAAKPKQAAGKGAAAETKPTKKRAVKKGAK